MSEPSEAEVRLLAEALENLPGPFYVGVWTHGYDVETANASDCARAILATGLHIVSAEQAATLDALARLEAGIKRIPGWLDIQGGDYGIDIRAFNPDHSVLCAFRFSSLAQCIDSMSAAIDAALNNK